MCLLIHQPKGVTFSKSDLKDYASYNGDGIGFAWPEAGKLQVVKFVNDIPHAIEAYYACVAGRPAMLHFRMATHGDTSLENCHPFLLTPEIAVAHNGILSIEASEKLGWSDTRLFAEHVLKPMALQNRDALFAPEVVALLGEMIGASNRLMFIRADGKYSIVNESAGTTHKGAWLSNLYAWSSPGGSGKYHGYRHWWRDEVDYDYATGAVTSKSLALVPADKASGREPAWDRADADNGLESADDRELDMALDDLVYEAASDNGEARVRRWLDQTPDLAARVLAEWWNMTLAAAEALVSERPEKATEWLLDIASESAAVH